MLYREHRYTAQDGLSLYYRDYGDVDGPELPVLCLPGLTRNSKDFYRLAAHLCETRRVICPDYRGRGNSEYDANAANYMPATYLNDIRHLLAITGVGRAIVIGTSLGGLLAMAVGAAMPTVLAGVVLNDVGPEIGQTGFGKILGYIGVDRPHSNWPDAIQDLKHMLPNLMFESEPEWLEAAQATWREDRDGRLYFDWDIRLVETLRKGPPIPDLWPLFHSLDKIPTLALRGALSEVLLPETIEKMAKSRTGLTQFTVQSAGHVPTLNEPAVRKTIDAFIASVQKP